MNIYNSFYDERTRTAIYQAVDSDGTYCVLLVRGNQEEIVRCSSSAKQADVFRRNVIWYRGY